MFAGKMVFASRREGAIALPAADDVDSLKANDHGHQETIGAHGNESKYTA